MRGRPLESSMSMDVEQLPTFESIQQAAQRIAPYAHRTPVYRSATLDSMSGASLFFKCENFQRAGAFKFRGACNAVFSLSAEESARGVTAHSAGNHAQALALAAKLRGIPAWIVMPKNAPAVKKAAVADYGAKTRYCEPTLQAREETTAQVIAETGATLVHPYDDYAVITGQATAALELVTDVPDLDVVVAPVSGGGLLAGTALAVHYASAGTRVVGGEPTGADDAWRSLKAGRIIPSENPQTIADGLLTSVGERNFPILQRLVSEIALASDEETMHAMRLVWERMKLVVEPSAAVGVAAVMQHKFAVAGKRIGIILSGGNVDIDLARH